jgi:hypothetical protein
MIAALLLRLGLSGKASQWGASLLMVLAVPALCAVAYHAGSGAGYSRAIKRAQAQELKSAKADTAELLRMRAENSRLSAEVGEARRSSETKYRVIREAVPHVVKELIDEGRADCRFDGEFIRLWNDATFGGSAGVPEATGHSSATATRSGAAGGEAEAGVADVLGNHIDNSEVCAETRRQLSDLLKWHREHP